MKDGRKQNVWVNEILLVINEPRKISLFSCEDYITINKYFFDLTFRFTKSIV